MSRTPWRFEPGFGQYVVEKAAESSVDGHLFEETGTISAFAEKMDQEARFAGMDARKADRDLVGDAAHLHAWERFRLASRAHRRAGNETRALLFDRMGDKHFERAEEIRKAREEHADLARFNAVPKERPWAGMAVAAVVGAILLAAYLVR